MEEGLDPDFLIPSLCVLFISCPTLSKNDSASGRLCSAATSWVQKSSLIGLSERGIMGIFGWKAQPEPGLDGTELVSSHLSFLLSSGWAGSSQVVAKRSPYLTRYQLTTLPVGERGPHS